MPAFIETTTTASGIVTSVNGTPRLTLSTTGVTLSGTVVGAGGNFALVETKTLSAVSGTTTFTGLAGDTDDQYMLTGELTASTGMTVELYFNGNTGTVWTGSYFGNLSNAGTPAGAGFSGAKWAMPFGSSTGSGERLLFSMVILADSRGGTFAPIVQAQICNDNTGGGGNFRSQTAMGAWTPKAAITSIGVAPSTGNITGRLSLYKITT